MAYKDKEDRKEYVKKYRAKNKEKISAYQKKYREANKEKRKAYNEANKEKIAAQMKAYHKANRERVSAVYKAWRESKKDGLFTVYLLVNENYVGQTNDLYGRLIHHKNQKRRDVSNVQIIGKYKTREEAKKVEAGYHARGYLGYWKTL